MLSRQATRQRYPERFLAKFGCALPPHSRSPFAHNMRLKERHNSATGPLCISFYGWNAIDQFMQAWKDAGFTVGGHMVWTKDYSSRQRYLKYHHEQAYVLLKGNPAKPSEPLTDVQPWAWTGNKAHPTEKSVKIIQPLVRAFSKPGDLVCDPFSGSGSTAVAAALAGRRYLGLELEEQYCIHARNRLAGVQRYLGNADKLAA